MESSMSNAAWPNRTRSEKGRCSWSPQEDQALMDGLREIIQTEWKSKNGFRPGYLNILEKYMRKIFPTTDLKANPHINSRIHGWKKNHASLFTMLSKSGIGYNSTTKMIEAMDEAWESYVKIDGNAKNMRYKAWPMYDAWCEIIGRDRATGEAAEGFVEAVNSVLNETVPTEDDPLKGFQALFEELGDTGETMSISNVGSSCPVIAKQSRKRKAVDRSDHMVEILGKLCVSTEARLGEIASRIGYEQGISKAHKEVWAVVEQFEGLSLHDKLRASKLLVQNTKDLKQFFSLPPHAREEFAKLKLYGDV